ncbi:hypothetical protein E3E12_07865 [Formicincola oecophyllae]|uniref:Uncharacterized protein n=1 Tax=Formicincola oecophyllae TaxID=2558361 RepID=A0A4Y6U9Q3_9PROT|nr:hypothetical protein [Formicincola oecophyllae]QDH14112.1 hypothetical protein E3E12_07865 [Formicincola oecophyllae]
MPTMPPLNKAAPLALRLRPTMPAPATLGEREGRLWERFSHVCLAHKEAQRQIQAHQRARVRRHTRALAALKPPSPLATMAADERARWLTATPRRSTNPHSLGADGYNPEEKRAPNGEWTNGSENTGPNSTPNHSAPNTTHKVAKNVRSGHVRIRPDDTYWEAWGEKVTKKYLKGREWTQGLGHDMVDGWAPDADKIIATGQELDLKDALRGLTKIGRSFEKHANRPGKTGLPQPKGNAAAKNAQGLEIVKKILSGGSKNIIRIKNTGDANGVGRTYSIWCSEEGMAGIVVTADCIFMHFIAPYDPFSDDRGDYYGNDSSHPQHSSHHDKSDEHDDEPPSPSKPLLLPPPQLKAQLNAKPKEKEAVPTRPKPKGKRQPDKFSDEALSKPTSPQLNHQWLFFAAGILAIGLTARI